MAAPFDNSEKPKEGGDQVETLGDQVETLNELLGTPEPQFPDPGAVRAREWGDTRRRGRELGLHQQVFASTKIYEAVVDLKASVDAVIAEVRALRADIAELRETLKPKK